MVAGMVLNHGPPNEALMNELPELAAAGRGMLSALEQTNRLPDDFLQAEMQLIVEGLTELPNGMADSCRDTLTIARNRLPKIARENILTNARADETEARQKSPDDIPLRRGDVFDAALDKLISATTKALTGMIQLQNLFHGGTKITYCSPVDHLGDNVVSGRPDDWVRRGQGGV